jgi:hypothetical protein
MVVSVKIKGCQVLTRCSFADQYTFYYNSVHSKLLIEVAAFYLKEVLWEPFSQFGSFSGCRNLCEETEHAHTDT